MTAINEPQSTSDSDCDATQRLIAALNDANATFTRDQALFLLATGQRWGYEARIADELAEAEKRAAREADEFAEFVQTNNRIMSKVDARRTADAALLLPRVGDFLGTDITAASQEKAA